MSEPTPKRRRRWFSISLRGLLVLVLVVGGLMGWKARKASLQRRAVVRIERLRGVVSYDWQKRADGQGRPIKAQSAPSGPIWLRKILGDEYFQEVISVTLPDPLKPEPALPKPPEASTDSPEWEQYEAEYRRIEDEQWATFARDQLACLEGLDRIEILHYYGPRLKSEGEARLGKLSRLKELTTSTPLDGEGVVELARLTELESLTTQFKLSDPSALSLLAVLPKLKKFCISGNVKHVWGMPVRGVAESDSPDKITDPWLAQIGRLRQLTTLSIDGSEITDDGLRSLQALEQLEGLSFDSPLITNAGLAHLKTLKSLDYLSISPGPDLTADGMVHLRGLTNLKTLFLAGLPMSNLGLRALQDLPNLEDLIFSRGQLDDATLKEFQATRPRVSITIQPSFSISR